MAYFARHLKQGVGDPKPEKKEKAKPKPIPKESKKRKEQRKEYTALRSVFLANKKCVIYPNKKATDVHHTYSGKDRATHYLDVKTWLPVSREGHVWIHEHSKEARKLGYLK